MLCRNILAAFSAFISGFIGKYFDLIAAMRAFVQCHPPHILCRTINNSLFLAYGKFRPLSRAKSGHAAWFPATDTLIVRTLCFFNLRFTFNRFRIHNLPHSLSYSTPCRAFHLSSPRHCRADAHHSIQDGACSL